MCGAQFGGNWVYYINFWASYWKNLAELTEGTDSLPATKSPATQATIKHQYSTSYKHSLSPEDKYAYLTEYGTQILALFDAEGNCNYVSSNFESITGNCKSSAAEGEFYNIIAEESRDRLCELIRLQHSASAPQIFRAKMQHADGKTQWYVFMLHPKKSPTQNEIVCVMENIHENILTQNTLQKARMEAELALRSRSEFLANMSHDLRTPLNAVLGFSQMITGEVIGPLDNPHYKDYATHIQESGYDLLAKIEDLLEIANLDAGHINLDKTVTKVGEVMKQVVDAQTHHAHSRQIRLVCDATNNSTELFIDRVKIQHIIGHLVSNAIKNCQSGCQINIRTSKLKDGGFRLRVTDNGCGIDEVKLAQIRSALSQENCWTSKFSQGIGLGLALAKELVQLHGGHVSVDSERDKGTTVDVYLPAECVLGSQSAKIDYIRQLVG